MGGGNSFNARRGRKTKTIIRAARPVKIWIKFLEYVEFSSTCKNKDHVPSTVLNQILTFNVPPNLPEVERRGRALAIPVKDKWIYIFKKYSWGCSLNCEIKVIEENGKQKYKLVDWKTEKTRRIWQRGKYPRDLRKKTYNDFDKSISKLFSFDGSFETFVLLSKIQLPLHRIEFYRKHPEVLAKRALHIPSNVKPRFMPAYGFLQPFVRIAASPADSTGKKPAEYMVSLLLVDFIEIAGAFQDEFIKLSRMYNEYVLNKRQAKKRYLADMIWGLSQKREKMKGWIRYNDLKKFRERENKRLEDKHRNFINACGQKCSWMLTDGYVATRDDYNGDVEIEKKIQNEEAWLSEGNIGNRKGLEYLKRIAGDEKSWYYKYFFDEKPFACWGKSISATKAFAGLYSDFLIGRIAYLQGKAGYRDFCDIMRGKERIGKARPVIGPKVQIRIQEEASIILTGRRIDKVKLTKSKEGKYFWEIKGEKHDVIVKGDKYDVMNKPKKTAKILEQRRKWFKKLDSVTGMILLPMQFFNLYNSLNSFADRYGKEGFAMETVKLVGATTDGLSSLEALVGKRLTEKVSKRAFPVLGIVGAICDYAVGVSETYKNVDKGKWGLGLAYATTALAATAIGAGAALQLAGVLGSTAVTAFGLSAAAFGIIGVIIFVVGVLLIYIFTEEPLEEWAEECAWGEDSRFKGVEVKNITKRELDKQIRGLFEILCEFEVKCGYYDKCRPILSRYSSYDHTRKGILLRITPRLFNANISRFVVKNLKIKFRTGIFEKEALVTVKKMTLRGPTTSGRVRYVDYLWTWKELHQRFGLKKKYNEKRPLTAKGEFECSVQLDFRGNETEMYPKKAKQCEGDLEVIRVFP